MPLTFSFVGGAGGEDLQRSFVTAAKLLPEDFRYALERQKERILSRTAQGQDAVGNPFAPYSEHGPYYYYPTPGHRSGQRAFAFVEAQEKRRRAGAATRKMRQLGLSGAGSQVPFDFAKGKVHKAAGAFGIRFESYAAFKRALGRSTVDLLGPSAPHMLQAIQVLNLSDRGGTIGIYGEEADRAEGHNVGQPSRHLPQREFFAFSENDADLIIRDIDQMLGARLTNQGWA